MSAVSAVSAVWSVSTVSTVLLMVSAEGLKAGTGESEAGSAAGEAGGEAGAPAGSGRLREKMSPQRSSLILVRNE